jgi:hypothetical protein
MNKIHLFFLLLLSVATLQAQSMQITTALYHPRIATIYDFVISINEEVPSKSQILLIFPSQFDLSKVSVADSRTLDGGLEVSVKQDTVEIKRSGRGKNIDANTPIDLKIGLIVNPADMQEEYLIGCLLRQDNRVLLEQSMPTSIEMRK